MLCVCYAQYDVDQHVPKVLACGHVFCLHCLQNITRQHELYDIIEYISVCPLCRAETRKLAPPRLLLPRISLNYVSNAQYMQVVCVSIICSCNDATNMRFQNEVNNICALFPTITSTHIANPDVIQYACGAIQRLAYNNGYCTSLSCVCPYMHAVLLTHMSNPDVMLDIFKTIINLSFDNHDNRLSDVCVHMHTVLTTWMDNPGVMSMVCNAIANLSANNDNCARLVDVCPHMHTVLSTHTSNPSVVIDACRAIINLSRNDDNRAKLSDVCPCIHTILSKYPGNTKVSEKASAVICGLKH